MNYGSTLITISLITIIIIIAIYFVPKGGDQKIMVEKPVLNKIKENNMENKKQEVGFSTWTGFKFGFGFGIGLFLASCLIATILTFMGFSLTKILFGSVPLFQ